MNDKADKTPVFLSALVYPGAGQFLQRRWKAGLFFSLAFTVFFVLLLFTVITPLMASLDAAFEWAAHYQNQPFRPVSLPRVVVLFLACVILYIVNLADVARAARTKAAPLEK